ncbi:hypothetical protein D3C85_1702250 [compost metagenome]
MGMSGFELLNQLQAVDLRHPDVCNDHINLKGGQGVQQLLAVGIRSGDKKSPALLADHPGQAFANQNLIIYNHYTQQSGYPP